MTDFGPGLDLIILVVAALLPALIYLAWVRKSERFQKEGWGTLLASFGYGAVFATLTAAFVEVAIVAAGNAASSQLPGPEFTFLNSSSSLGALFLVLVIAPFVEEGLKAGGVTRARSKGQIRTLSDGPVIGASVGLGFGFTETFLYGVALFITGGLVAALELVVIRSLSSVLLHGSTTGMFGYGYAAARLQNASGATGNYYLIAVLMHSGFNALASLDVIAQLLGYGTALQNTASIIGLGAAILFAFAAIEHVRRLVSRNETMAAARIHPRFPPPKVRTLTVVGRR
jgi:protease PrsW